MRIPATSAKTIPTYQEQLDDPRWIGLAKLIRIRDEFKCVECGAKDCVLDVHHTRYERGALAWEVDPKQLKTLCRECHMRTESELRIARILFSFQSLASMERFNKACAKLVRKRDVTKVLDAISEQIVKMP